jgi:hypothetical protein
MLKTCTGEFMIWIPVMLEEIKLWAAKNFGLVFPELLPLPSQ